MIDRVDVTLATIAALGRQINGFAKGRALRAAETKARLGPSEAAARRELDRDIIAGRPARGRVPRIARILRFDPDVRAYRESLGLPSTERTLIQWTARMLDRLMK
jgi:hypothetical protein